MCIKNHLEPVSSDVKCWSIFRLEKNWKDIDLFMVHTIAGGNFLRSVSVNIFWTLLFISNILFYIHLTPDTSSLNFFLRLFLLTPFPCGCTSPLLPLYMKKTRMFSPQCIITLLYPVSLLKTFINTIYK